MPTLTRKQKPDEIQVALYSFSGHDISIAQGARLRADSPIVQKFADRFVPEDTPDDELHRLRSEAQAPPPAPDPIGRVKLRVLPVQGGGDPLSGGRNQEVLQGARILNSGDTLEAEGKDAEYLINSGICEVVKHLRPKPEQQPSTTRSPA